MTSVPVPTFGPQGFIAPAESAVLTGVIADINSAFGGALNPALETPQGQLASSLTAIIGFANSLFLLLTNQVDPAYSSGRMQDAIARIYFLDRNPAEPTTVQCLCMGATGTFITTGSLALAADGNIYSCTGGGAIGPGGTVTLPFACTVNGPVSCPAGSLNTIYRAVPGWDTITNPTDGVIGNNVESRADFEARRSASVAVNAIGTLPAIRGAVLSVPNVLDAYVTENSTASAATIGGVSVPARSLYVSVAGGASADIANAIWRKKPPGCGMGGNTTVTVLDRNSGYSTPYPSYSVTYETPTPTPIKFAVQIFNSTAVPADATTQIQAAIIAAFVGADGGQRAKIGSTIFASRFYAGIAQLGDWAQIVSVLLGISTPTLNDVTMHIDQVPTITASNITVALVTG